MRILISLAAFLLGLGLIAYSYVGAYVEIVQEMERSETMSEVQGPIMTLFAYLMNGGAPQLPNYLYLGALLVVVAVVSLIVRRNPNRHDQ